MSKQHEQRQDKPHPFPFYAALWLIFSWGILIWLLSIPFGLPGAFVALGFLALISFVFMG